MHRSFIASALAITLATLQASSAPGPSEGPDTVQAVAGSGVHDFTTAIVHSAAPTPTGMIQRSTETVDLTGDLTGRLLYHPTSVFDLVQGTLVNTSRR